MRKAAPYILLLVLAIVLIFARKCQNNRAANTKYKPVSNRSKPTGDTNRDRGFDRRTSYLEYSRHANCRMQCRDISKEEVEETMREGKINYGKSDLKNARCPRYAVEDMTLDHQRVRVVFAQCNNYTEVVTVIDLGKNWECDCPGDDDKYKNRN